MIPGGPAASQVAIKDLGTNGGGFFNANSAHPFENPTPLSNAVIIVTMLVIPACLVLRVRPNGRAPPRGLGHIRRHDSCCSP